MKNFISYILLAFGLVCFFLLAYGAISSHPNVEDLELAILSKELGMWKACLHLAVTYDSRHFTNFMHGFNL